MDDGSIINFYKQWVCVGCYVMVGGISLCDIKQAGGRALSRLGFDPLKVIVENQWKVKRFFLYELLHACSAVKL